MLFDGEPEPSRLIYTVKESRCVVATEMALRVESTEVDEPFWVPRSQIEGGEVRDLDDEGELTVSLWFAEQRGWI